jgi:hypothetical protein
MLRSLAQEDEPRCAPRLLPTGDPARIRPILVGPRSTGHCPTTATTTAKSGPTPPLTQHGLRQLRAPCSDLGRRRVGRGYGGRPRRPQPSQPAAAWPTAALHDLTRRTADAETHRHRTTTPDTDTWTLRRPHRTPDAWTGTCGHWTLAPDTGHRTLAEDADRVTKARPASEPPGPTTPSDRALARPKCSCGRRVQRSAAHAGSA